MLSAGRSKRLGFVGHVLLIQKRESRRELLPPTVSCSRFVFALFHAWLVGRQAAIKKYVSGCLRLANPKFNLQVHRGHHYLRSKSPLPCAASCVVLQHHIPSCADFDAPLWPFRWRCSWSAFTSYSPPSPQLAMVSLISTNPKSQLLSLSSAKQNKCNGSDLSHKSPMALAMSRRFYA